MLTAAKGTLRCAGLSAHSVRLVPADGEVEREQGREEHQLARQPHDGADRHHVGTGRRAVPGDARDGPPRLVLDSRCSRHARHYVGNRTISCADPRVLSPGDLDGVAGVCRVPSRGRAGRAEPSVRTSRREVLGMAGEPPSAARRSLGRRRVGPRVPPVRCPHDPRERLRRHAAPADRGRPTALGPALQRRRHDPRRGPGGGRAAPGPRCRGRPVARVRDGPGGHRGGRAGRLRRARPRR